MAEYNGEDKKKALSCLTRRIVVSLLKGGVAKSETAVNLAHGMARAGLHVLLVDTDVQAQCNDMLGVTPPKGLADVISGWTHPQEAIFSARENLWLLAGGNDLAGVKMEIARREMAPEAVLDETLANYEGQFHAIILDTAPGWDTLLVNALYCSREVLSPVSMEPVALSGLIRFEERLKIIQKYNKGLTLKWIVPTFVDGRVKKTGEILRQLSERYGDLVTSPIKYSVKLSEAPAFGRTIYEHDPRGQGAEAYQELTDRVINDAPVDVPRLERPVGAAREIQDPSPAFYLEKKESPFAEISTRDTVLPEPAERAATASAPMMAPAPVDQKITPDIPHDLPPEAASQPEEGKSVWPRPMLRRPFLKERLARAQQEDYPPNQDSSEPPGTGPLRTLDLGPAQPVTSASQFEEHLIARLKQRLKQRGFTTPYQDDQIIEKIRERFKSGSP